MGGEIGGLFNDLIKDPVWFFAGALFLLAYAYFYFYWWRFTKWQKRLTIRFIQEGVLEEGDPSFGSEVRLWGDRQYMAHSKGLQHFVFWNKRYGKCVIPFSQIWRVRFFFDRAGEEEEVQWRDGELYERVGEEWQLKTFLSIPVWIEITYEGAGEEQFRIALHRLDNLKEWAGRVEVEV